MYDPGCPEVGRRYGRRNNSHARRRTLSTRLMNHRRGWGRGGMNELGLIYSGSFSSRVNSVVVMWDAHVLQ